MTMWDKVKNLSIAPLLGLIWCVAVMFSYYVANAGYYNEKISVFGQYFLGFLG